MSKAQLGKLVTANTKRDAVHVPFIPMQAPIDLNPGDRITRNGYTYPGNVVAIVDPFLEDPVKKGQWFLALPLPKRGEITLNHEWSSVDFPHEEPNYYEEEHFESCSSSRGC